MAGGRFRMWSPMYCGDEGPRCPLQTNLEPNAHPILRTAFSFRKTRKLKNHSIRFSERNPRYGTRPWFGLPQSKPGKTKVSKSVQPPLVIPYRVLCRPCQYQVLVVTDLLVVLFYGFADCGGGHWVLAMTHLRLRGKLNVVA